MVREAEFCAPARRACAALACREFARADFRLDAGARPRFLALNPRLTFVPDGCFGAPAEFQGRPPADLLVEVLAGGPERLGLG